MKKIRPEQYESMNIISENIEHLKELFPEAFFEGDLDFEVLCQLLGDAGSLDEQEEKYGLNWHGKKKARQAALTPSTGTLIPYPKESINWKTTQNLYIEGDNLEVLKLLQRSYANGVKVIYIDPPYNTGKDFIYPDKYSDTLETYLRYTGQVDEDGMKISSRSETHGRKHRNWLNMIYPRIKIAKNLLTNDGAMFVSIDDNEQSNLKKICDEIFGPENFIACFSWQKFHSVKSNAQFNISASHEYVLCYAKNSAFVDFNKMPMSEEALKVYKNPDSDPRGPWRTAPLTVSLLTGARGEAYRRTGESSGLYEIIAPNGKKHRPGRGRCWIAQDSIENLKDDNRIWWGKDGDAVPMRKIFLSEQGGTKSISTFWSHAEYGSNKKANEELKELFSDRGDSTINFPTPKPTTLIQKIIEMSDSDTKDHIVLDFFAGSSTTADAVLRMNASDNGRRRFIMVQLPEPLDGDEVYATIADIGKDRIRRAIKRIKKSSDGEQDYGFKVFKLSRSNIQPWNLDPMDLEKSLARHTEHLVAKRTEQDILYELLLKLGIDITVSIEARRASGKKIYSIGYGALFACLTKSISKKQIEDIGQCIADWHHELAPELDTHVFFRDSAFSNDVSKANMVAFLEQNGIAHVRSL